MITWWRHGRIVGRTPEAWWWAFVCFLFRPWCRHDGSLTGDAEFWRCDTCGGRVRRIEW